MDRPGWKLILPEGILKYFEVSGPDKTSEGYIISLVEKPLLSGEFKDLSLSSKGFFDEIHVIDFPIRGKVCYPRHYPITSNLLLNALSFFFGKW